ncbi:uncharacterized protein LOC119579889 [Penaeus monodon]|uniref:uncharacterized protein LOC119579889 n=1 Tax=Penaeus monodon TaxID=6687 RepID=UPI0018A73E05|nr:uncharacterized protein LOC119579889 [Penaeus monodon]
MMLKVKEPNSSTKSEPMLDDHDVIRVGGRRLSEYSDCNAKPILLPKDHPVAALIVQDWRPLNYRILRNCFNCHRVNSKPLTHRQGELPLERILADSPPFTQTRVYYFGPFNMAYIKRNIKRFGCVFTCLSSRAVHLELLYSLDADEFINALMLLIMRRGISKKIFSDRRSNFQRANQNIRAKTHSWIDDSRLHTLFCEVEATLNSRPITATMGDTSDPEALIPDHILRLGKGFRLPMDDVSQEL